MHRICKDKADRPTTKIAKAVKAKQIPIVPRSYARSENQLVVQVAKIQIAFWSGYSESSRWNYSPSGFAT
jgi:hypothetical protein